MWIGTGWKMNMTVAEATRYAGTLRIFVEAEAPPCQVFLLPPFTALAAVRDALAGTTVQVGAQNAHWEDAGAYTGEISCSMIRDCGAALVEIGHSGRRQHFGETDETANLKVKAAVRNGLRPLICVGESAEERDAGRALEVVERQAARALEGLAPSAAAAALIAYEPVWAIGEGGESASPDYANQIAASLRQRLSDRLGAGVAATLALLYGGSVDRDNATAFLLQPQIDGLFIGRAAWQVDGFIDILRRASQISLRTGQSSAGAIP